MIKIDSWNCGDCTLGRLSCGDFKCFTLELPWKGNEKNISCIPEGSYPAEIYESPKFGKVVLLNNVPNRTFIEIHAGNYTSQIRGCILVGDSIKYLNNDGIPDVTNSKATLKSLLKALPKYFHVQVSRGGA